MLSPRIRFWRYSLIVAMVNLVSCGMTQPSPAAPAQASATPAPEVLHDIQAPLDWYVWQGYWRAGRLEQGAAVNCGPAVVAMALRYSTNNALQLSPEQVRDTIPDLKGTRHGAVAKYIEQALDHWQVPSRRLSDLAAIEQAIAADHLVLVNIAIGAIRRGSDQSPVEAADLPTAISGRYYDYDQQHGIVLKGIIRDARSDTKYFVVYDPNVWGGNPRYYYDGQAQFPKGLNRLYAYTEVAQAMQPPHFFEAIEVLATPWAPVVVPDAPASPWPDAASHMRWCAGPDGDLATATVCDAGPSRI